MNYLEPLGEEPRTKPSSFVASNKVFSDSPTRSREWCEQKKIIKKSAKIIKQAQLSIVEMLTDKTNYSLHVKKGKDAVDQNWPELSTKKTFNPSPS